MFRDYYAILEIDSYVSQNEIKSAYHRLSKKWHPDVNPNTDVTSQMQDINEAYFVLKDTEKRRRYDAEYKKFKQYQQTSTERINNTKDNHNQSSTSQSTYHTSSNYYDYNVNDEKVWSDMETAHDEAARLVKEFISHLINDGKSAANGAWEAIYPYIIISIVFSIIGIIAHALY